MEVNEEYNEACNTESPGVLLLADILPSLLMNLICPFLPLAMKYVTVNKLILFDFRYDFLH